MKWALVICAAFLFCTQADARVHRRGRSCEAKIFTAKSNSVALENQAANKMGAFRFMTQAEVDEAVYADKLKALYDHSYYKVSPKLPLNRRYALPSTVAFVDQLSLEFYQAFHAPLMVDSAIRSADVQHKIARHNRGAALAYGSNASVHERGVAVDFSKHLTAAQNHWFLLRMLYYNDIGRVLVIEESKCWHVVILSNAFVSVDAVLPLPSVLSTDTIPE